MPIDAIRIVGSNYPEQHIGLALANLSRNHVAHVDGIVGIGFGYDSCNAAVAVEAGGAARSGYIDNPRQANGMGAVGLDFVAIYGSSRLYRGLDHQANSALTLGTSPFSDSGREQHAEQTAILLADHLAIPFWQDDEDRCHVYVDFTPCDKCEPWLEARMEDWFVHCGVQLNNKADYRKVRVAAHRDLKKRWTEEAKKQRHLQQMAIGKSKRAAIMAKKRGQ